jgi:hypothetical protein
MTQLLFNLFNHNVLGQRSLEDPMGIVGHQLKALGHNVVWEPKNDRFLMPDSGINVIVEGFTPGSTEVLRRAHAQGARFLFIATEEPTPKGFNHGRDAEMVKRQSEFPRAAEFAEAILYLVPGAHVHDWYNQWAPAAYIELGYAPSLVRAPDGVEPQFDFGFFGSLSKRRLKILKALARFIGTEKAVRVEATFPDQVTRDRIMREARVILQIRKYDEMGLISSTRCNTALCLGRPVVAEPHSASDDSPWPQIVKFAKDLDHFMNLAVMTRAMGYKGVHAAQFAKFKEMLTPQHCLGRALAEVKMNLRTDTIALARAS